MSQKPLIVIERAVGQDAEAVSALDQVVIHDRSREPFLVESIRRGHVLIARVDRVPVGFAVVEQSFYGQSFISLLIVHPDHRRRGVATDLVRYIERSCLTEKLFTSTNASNAAMQGLCERLGFIKSGWIDNLDPGDPEIVYFKRLVDPAIPGMKSAT